MARQKLSRRVRNQAKWDAHAVTQQNKPGSSATDIGVQRPIMVGLGSYAGGKRPELSTGSIQYTPPKPTVTQRKGIKLQPFTDYVPPVPQDYATTRPSHLDVKPIYDQKTGARQDRAPRPHREMLDSEMAKRDVRPSHEVAMMGVDRTSGSDSFKSYAARHEADARAGLYRDGLGRVIRTTDMEDAEASVISRTAWLPNKNGVLSPHQVTEYRVTGGMTTSDYATMHSVPIRRDAHTREMAARANQAQKQAVRDQKQAVRDQREQDRLQRRADRMAGKAGASHTSRADLDTAARAYLAGMGIKDPTPEVMRAARDVIVHAKQVAQYTNA